VHGFKKVVYDTAAGTRFYHPQLATTLTNILA